MINTEAMSTAPHHGSSSCPSGRFFTSHGHNSFGGELPPQTPGTTVAPPKLSVLLLLNPLSGLCLNWFAADSEEVVLSTSPGYILILGSGLRAPAGGQCLCCCWCFIEAELLVVCCFCVCLLRKYHMAVVNMIDPVMLDVCGCLYRAFTLSPCLLHIL